MVATTVSPFALILSSLAYFSGNLELSNPYVEVDTALGRLRGVKNVARNGKIYMEFLGIPYAQAPVGDLRFEPPQPPLPWTGTKDASVYGRSCLQYEVLTHWRTGHEDCLNLNVYTTQVVDAEEDLGSRRRRRLISSFFAPIFQASPKQPDRRRSSGGSPRTTRSLNLKPVIVYVHGGLFMSGFPYVYRPKYFMENGDAVLVTLNYRVNSFGFLNTGDETVRGNMGLKDQTMALRWVQENIARFGGDPNKVTLMGQSAGAASVHYHLVSPLSSGLFHRAISQSGTMLNSWAHSPDPATQAKRLATYLNCPTDNTRAMVKCMKSKSALDIERFHKEYLEPIPDQSTIFAPSVEAVNDEGTFLSASPRELLERGEIANKVPWIVGVNNGEGHFCALYLMKTAKQFQEFAIDLKSHLPRLLNFENHPNKVGISQRIYNHYFSHFATTTNSEDDLRKLMENHDTREELLAQISKLFSHTTFFNPVHDSIKYMAPHMPVYPYWFSFEGEDGLSGVQNAMSWDGPMPRLLEFGHGVRNKRLLDLLGADGDKDERGKKFGVAHADELNYQFNIPVIAQEIVPGSKYYEFSNEFINLWMSFVKNGAPSTFQGVVWPPASRDLDAPLEYLDIGKIPRMIPEPFKESIAFWRSLAINATLV